MSALNEALTIASKFVSLYAESESCVIAEYSGDISGEEAKMQAECQDAYTRIGELTMSDSDLSELDKLRALLSEAAAGFENLGVHAPGCGYYAIDTPDTEGPCDCGLERLITACEDASQKGTA